MVAGVSQGCVIGQLSVGVQMGACRASTMAVDMCTPASASVCAGIFEPLGLPLVVPVGVLYLCKSLALPGQHMWKSASHHHDKVHEYSRACCGPLGQGNKLLCIQCG